MAGAIDLSTQHQISLSNEIISPSQESEPNMQVSNCAAGDDLKEVLPLVKTEFGISKQDMRFLLTTIESFGSDYENNANTNEFCTPSDRFAFPLTQQSTSGGILAHEKPFISCCDSIGSFDIDAYQEKDWIQFDKEKNHPLTSDQISSDMAITSSKELEDSFMKPISINLSENELPELDIVDCISISEESTVEGYLSVFEESDSDCHDNTEFVNQSFSSSNTSFKDEDGSHGIMATDVKRPIKCDNSQSFPVPDYIEISSHITPYQEKKWLSFYIKLQQFHKEERHCCIPNNHPKYKRLGNWIKRQRRQYKNMKNGRKSALTAKRINMLESIDFIWDSHDVIWRERLEALKAFRHEFGHCNVPSRYSKDKKLGIWVKCQRHQYKLYRKGEPNSMSLKRICLLTNLGFEWIGKSYKPSTSKQCE